MSEEPYDMKKQKKIKQILWTQDWGTYNDKTVVAVGFTVQEIIDLMKADKCIGWAKAVEARKDEFEEMCKGSHFFSSWVMEENGKDFHYSIMFLLHWKPDVEHYKILAHELIHGISFIMARKMNVLKENEAFAHQHSFLFESVVIKLNEWYSRRNNIPVGKTPKRK